MSQRHVFSCFVWTTAGPEEVEIVHGKRGVTADTALRLGRFFGTSVQFWLNLQSQFDLDVAEDRAAEAIATIIPLQTA